MSALGRWWKGPASSWTFFGMLLPFIATDAATRKWGHVIVGIALAALMIWYAITESPTPPRAPQEGTK